MATRPPSTVGILLDLVKNGARMGPIANARMTAAAVLALPYGVSFAGAQSCIQAVKSGPLLVSGPALYKQLSSTAPITVGNAEGAATLTADLVDLGWIKTVTWIALNLADRDRSDVVVEVGPCRGNK